MRIGIDIDDTITNSWEYLIPIYRKIFNIEIDEKSLPYYDTVRDKMSLEEFLEIGKQNENVMKEVPIKADASEFLNKLKEEGHTIIFITARGKSYEDPYKTTKEYLDKHNIPYDKIIVDTWDKAKACQEEKIDLFIDDAKKHCKEVSNLGIDVLMMETNYNKDDTIIKYVKNWKEVYNYIKSR